MVESFMFLKEKKDRKLKSQEVIGGNVQRAYFYGVISTVQWRDRIVRAPEKVRGQVLSFPAKLHLKTAWLLVHSSRQHPHNKGVMHLLSIDIDIKIYMVPGIRSFSGNFYY